MIFKHDVELFRQYASKVYYGNLSNHPEVKDHQLAYKRINALLETLKEVCDKAINQLFSNAVVYRPPHCLSPSAKTSFKKYIPFKICPNKDSKYADLVFIWFFLEGRENYPGDLRIALNVMDDYTSQDTQKKREELSKNHHIETSVSLENDMEETELIEWLISSINKLDFSYEEFCEKLQPSLDADVETFNLKKQKTKEINNLVKLDIEPDNVIKKNNIELNQIYYGPPGTGKTYITAEKAVEICTDDINLNHLSRQELMDKYFQLIEEGRIAFVTFHQSYGYEEFIEGIRPVLTTVDQAIPDSIGHVEYEVKSGIFKNICEKAVGSNENYVIIIDEINRGNISKIFGELITLIEDDKRESISAVLPYSHQSFFVPKNLFIIGTMNTADRSLANIDIALRRRFHFQPMMPDIDILRGLKVREIKVDKMLETINKRIEALYDKDHTIGHAYFTKLLLNDSEGSKLSEEDRFFQLQLIFRKKIIPLLEEYFFDDWSKIRLILGDTQKLDRKLQFIEVQEDSQNWEDLFGHQEQSDDLVELKHTYHINNESFDNPLAYIGIYSKVS